MKKGVDKANELRYTNEAVPQKGERKHLENYIVHQQTSQVNSDRKIEKKRTRKETRPSEKVSKNAERRLEIELKSLILAQDERWRRA